MTKQDLKKSIEEAVALLKKGELVVFPTETVYGLGARADQSEAVQKIYRTKGRPSNNPLIIHFGSLALLKEWVPLPPSAEKLAQTFWPGPLTLIVSSSDRIAGEARAGLASVALRIPRHPLAQELLQKVALPIAAPSANRSSHISPTSPDHVRKSLKEKTPFLLEGGNCEFGLESTVLDLTSSVPRILRPGSITQSAIEKHIGPIQSADSCLKEGEAMLSPGLLAKHYSPQAKVLLRNKEEIEEENIPPYTGVIYFSESLNFLSDVKNKIRLSAKAQGYASQLYAALYHLESQACEVILIEKIPDGEEWEAIRNRLSRMI